MQYLDSLINKKISIDYYFYDLIELGWKYDLEESDLFVRLSRTFWQEGIKVSLIFEEFSCVPPAEEILKIEALRFYSFDLDEFPKRTIGSLFLEMITSPHNTWTSLDEYVAHLKTNYPLYLPHADFNTGIGHDEDHLLKEINPTNVPESVMENVISDLKNVEEF